MADFMREMPPAIKNPQGKGRFLAATPASVKELLLALGGNGLRL
jgi:hypothetical protein